MRQDNRETVPYEDLHIYYLEGCLHPDFQCDSNSFIGNWEEDGFSFLFFTEPADEQIKHLLASQGHLTLLDTFNMSYEQWHGGKISTLHAAGFRVAPPWEQMPGTGGEPDGLRHIILDPGVVFGTVLHPTTRDCIEAIDMAFSSQIPSIVSDLGTGTGILALAAAAAGADLTLAVDINRLCVRTTRKNIDLNKFSGKILPIQGSAENFVDYPVDFMIANIHYDIMKKIVDAEGFYRKKRFLLSGLLKSEAKAIENQLVRHNAEILKIWDQNGIWFTFLGKAH